MIAKLIVFNFMGLLVVSLILSSKIEKATSNVRQRVGLTGSPRTIQKEGQVDQ